MGPGSSFSVGWQERRIPGGSAQCKGGQLIYTTTDEHELCIWLNQHPDAVAEALAARRRWLYIGMVADAACQGRILDRSLGAVCAAPEAYRLRAQRMIGALDGWLSRNSAGTGLSRDPVRFMLA